MTTPTDPASLPLADTPLGRTVALGPTDIWNDSCAEDELQYAIDYGAVGATANPTIVMDVWKKDPARWRARLREIAAERPVAHGGRARVGDGGGDVAARRAAAAAHLRAIRGAQGSPVDADQPGLLPQLRADAGARPPLRLAGTEHHRQVPGHGRGHRRAMEEATYHGVTINCTVSFSVAQAVAAAEAVERGLRRREAEGLRTDDMGPVITIMVGPHRGLAAGAGRSRRHHHRPGRAGVVRRGGVQAGRRDLRRSAATGRGRWRRPSGTTSTGRSSSAGSAWSRCPSVVAEALQRLRRGGAAADGGAGGPGDRRGAVRSLPGLRARLRAGRPLDRRVRRLPAHRAHAAPVRGLVPRAAGDGLGRDRCPTRTRSPRRDGAEAERRGQEQPGGGLSGARSGSSPSARRDRGRA